MKDNVMLERALLPQAFLNITPSVCALMVILIHVWGSSYLQGGIVSVRMISFFAHGLCTVAVPVFFFMSGYLFYRDVEQVGQVFTKQKKRVLSTLMPFLAWSTFYWLFYAVGSKVIPGIQTTVDFSLRGIFEGIVFYQYCFPMWYMFQLCVFILLAPVIFYALKNRQVSMLLLIATAVVGMFLCDSIEISVAGAKRAIFQFNFFAYYFAGCMMARTPRAQGAVHRVVNRLPMAAWVAALVLFSFAESLFFDGILESFNSRCLVPLVFVAFLGTMLKLCETKKHLPRARVSTMIIYGIHPLCGIILGRLILGRIALPNIAHYALSFVCVTALAWGAGFVMKHIKPIYAVFSGNR